MKKNVKDVTKQFHAAMERAKVLKQSARFLLAVSGGPDSMALLHLMATEYPNEILGVAHVDHCLRPSSAEEAAMVEQACRNYGIAFHLKRADVAAIARERKIGLEEAGRHLRYEFFSVLGYDYIMTAHHKNDQAETVLGNIVRGCGYNGIKGMVLKDGPLLRPFLEISKASLVAYCRQRHIEFAWDHTNDELCCRRNVLRHRVLPELETMNPAVIDALCRLSHLAEDEEQWMEQMAEEAFHNAGVGKEGDVSLECKTLASFPKALARRVLRKCAERAGGQLDYDTTERLFSLGEGKKIPLGGCYFCRRSGGRLIFYHQNQQPSDSKSIAPIPVNLHGETSVGNIKFSAVPYKGTRAVKSHGSALLPRTSLEQNAVFRSRRPGDWFFLSNGGKKKLSDFMIDEKIPAERRDDVLLLAVENRILWIVNYRVCESPQDDNIFFTLNSKK